MIRILRLCFWGILLWVAGSEARAGNPQLVIDSGFTTRTLVQTLDSSDNHGARWQDSLVWEITNRSGREQILYFSVINPTLDSIRLTDNGRELILGDRIAYRKRPFKHYNQVYPLRMQADATHRIRLMPTKQIRQNNFRIVLSTENTFIRTTNHDNFLLGIFFGVMFMFILLLVGFYIFSRHAFFFIYVAINVFSLLLYMQYSGSGGAYLWPYSGWVGQWITPLAAIAYVTSHILFIRLFFETSMRNNFNRVALQSLAVMTIFIVMVIFAEVFRSRQDSLEVNRIFQYCVFGFFLFYGLFLVLLSVYSYRESRRRETLWVLLGSLLHILNWQILINHEYKIFGIFTQLSTIQFFYSHLYVAQLNLFVTLAEVFLVTVFLAINYHKLIRQNDLSEQRLLFLQKKNINTYVLGQEEERANISQAIHQGVYHDIEKLKQQLQDFVRQYPDRKEIVPVIQDVDRTLQDIQNITTNYVAPDIQQMGLRELLLTSTEKLHSLVTTDYRLDSLPDNLSLNTTANIHLYRILQEISNNIIKHAAAGLVTIQAQTDANNLQLTIRDDGKGLSESGAQQEGIGLLNMESRVQSLNGSIHLFSQPGQGLTIHLIFPLKDVLA